MGAFDNLLSGVAGVEKADSSRSASTGTPVPDPYGPDTLDAELPIWARKAMTRGLVEQRGGVSDSVLKQDGPRRRAQLPDSLKDAIEEHNAVPKPYDPALLRDLSTSPVPQTYIDTLAQDAASAKWRLAPKDENTDLPNEDIAQAERTLRDLVPDATFVEFLEEWGRSILRLGDGTVVKHYPGGDPTNPAAEIVHVDSATMFKILDDHGFTDGYVQFTSGDSQDRTDFAGTEFETDEVVWTSWARRGNHVYGEGPIEKGTDAIEILEEIMEKELLDLVQGMPPGIISRPPEEEYPADTQDWENFKDDMKLHEGERHRLAFTKFPVEYTSFTPNYQELQLLERYKTKVTELGGVFKTNPSYAGFEFENVNRATDETQQEAYKQRGFRVLITRLEQAITMGIVPDLPLPQAEDLRFVFDRERTTAERESKASALRASIEAGKEAADAGLDVTWRDGMPEIEDGDMEAGNAGSSGGGGGGLFGSVETPEAVTAAEKQDSVTVLGFRGGVAYSGDSDIWPRFLNVLLDRGAEKIVDLKAQEDGEEVVYPESGLPTAENPTIAVHGLPRDSVLAAVESFDNLYLNPISGKDTAGGGTIGRGHGIKNRDRLSEAEIAKLDDLLFAAHTEQIFPESVEAIEKVSFAMEDIPDYVREKIRQAIADGAVFDQFDSVPEDLERAKSLIEEVLEDQLTDESGWSLRTIRDDLQDSLPGLSKEEAETIARTESASVLNTAREKGYEERDDSATLKYKWVGPDDSRTTDACEELKDRTDPDRGGTPLPMPELVRLEREISNDSEIGFPELAFRKHTLHPNERHTFRRVLPHEMSDAGPGTVEASA